MLNTNVNKTKPNIKNILICLFFSKEIELKTEILYEISLINL